MASVLIGRTLNYIQAPDDPDLKQSALDGLNDGIDRLNMRTWKKIWGEQKLWLLENYDSYALDTTFKDPYYAEFLNADEDPVAQCQYIEVQQFLRTVRNPLDTPRFYTVDYSLNRFILNSKPQLAFVGDYPYITAFFSRRVQKFVADSTTTGIPGEFDSFLVWHARAQTAYDWGETGKGDRAELRAERAFKELIASDGNVISDWKKNVPRTGWRRRW